MSTLSQLAERQPTYSEIIAERDAAVSALRAVRDHWRAGTFATHPQGWYPELEAVLDKAFDPRQALLAKGGAR